LQTGSTARKKAGAPFSGLGSYILDQTWERWTQLRDQPEGKGSCDKADDEGDLVEDQVTKKIDHYYPTYRIRPQALQRVIFVGTIAEL
jgi:hypothetical protein